MPFLINRCQIDYDVKEVLRYKCIHLKDVILGQNHQGVVNRVDRVMYMTVLDIVATFDDDVKLSNDMKGVFGTKEENTKLSYLLL
jgi:hypothetical protein